MGQQAQRKKTDLTQGFSCEQIRANLRELLDEITLAALFHIDIEHVESAIARHKHDLGRAATHRNNASKLLPHAAHTSSTASLPRSGRPDTQLRDFDVGEVA